jgi:hypothetical protein
MARALQGLAGICNIAYVGALPVIRWCSQARA